MRVFICSTCRHELQFESMACPNCDSVVGYVPDRRDVVVLVADGPARYTVEGDASGALALPQRVVGVQLDAPR